MERVGRNLLIQLLSLRRSPASTLSNSIHAQYFGHLWKVPVSTVGKTDCMFFLGTILIALPMWRLPFHGGYWD